jgi:hypothetical protein
MRILLACMAVAYIEPPAREQAAQTLPRLLLHFMPDAVALAEVERVDLDRGAVRYRLVERIAGKGEEREFRHAIAPEGQAPAELRSLRAGARAVIFGDDHEGQSLTYVEGSWYHAKRAEDSWRRMTGLRPLYLQCFAGTADELAAALKRLLLGQEAVVRARHEGKDAWTKYSMKDPHRKVAVETPPKDAPPAAEPADVEKARATERKSELEELDRRLREARAAGAEELVRELVRERGKRTQRAGEAPRPEGDAAALRREREEIDRRLDRMAGPLRRAEGEERERLMRDFRRLVEEMVTIDARLKREEAEELERNREKIVEERIRRRLGAP